MPRQRGYIESLLVSQLDHIKLRLMCAIISVSFFRLAEPTLPLLPGIGKCENIDDDNNNNVILDRNLCHYLL